ncbi:very long chain fatty acid elongase 5-like [Haematobia irritans]|uniref:very long chain fatty acid elongase 5-like n=1 Tax=Haematobia irritans TaxID=7368 RepID=UPI003F4FF3A4
MLSEIKEHFLTTGGNDPRTRDLPISNSYASVLAILVIYVLFVKKIGPAFMAKRKPYNIRWLISLYNLVQVIYNGYMFILGTKYFITQPKYSWSCTPIDYTDVNENVMKLRYLGYIYFLNKIADCLDTVFFVLTKKYSHMSVLHIYHHATMIWGSFIYLNILLASQFTIIGYLNTLVHTIMYFYYLLTSLKLNLNLSVWKKRLTQFQIIQFFYYSLKLVVPLTNNWCGLPRFWLWTILLETISMVVLFTNFYYRNYIVKKPTQVKHRTKYDRMAQLPLINSYFKIVLILALYILFVTKIGQTLMANRKPFKLKALMQLYNIGQVALNTYIFIGLMKYYFQHQRYNWTCMYLDKADTSHQTKNLLHSTYLYYLSKYVDLIDTIFFILRKKNKQISFLHVYHHATMVWACFLYHNQFFGTVFTTIGLVNSFVHVLMYTYYLFATMDTKMNLDAWKPRLTEIQIIQFGYFCIKFGAALLNNNNCHMSYFWLSVFLLQNMFITAMFCSFYYKTYIVKPIENSNKNNN